MQVKKVKHQLLPTKRLEREALRDKGQFWTPPWVANAMALYCLQNHDTIHDPAVGEGAFLHAAKLVAIELGKTVKLSGGEIDAEAINNAKAGGLTEEDVLEVEIRDFILNPPNKPFPSIVANPPYIRHHRLSAEMKKTLKEISVKNLGKAIDGRAGLHIFFLIQALSLLEKNGRLCFIMPADTCEGVFAKDLWKWILGNYKLDAVLAFGSDASPFPGVDTNPLVFFISNSKPEKEFKWARCIKWGTEDIHKWVQSNFNVAFDDLDIHTRTIQEGYSTGLSRDPENGEKEEVTLDKFAKVVRGIATGANEFFFLTEQQVSENKIPFEYTKRAVGRTRDASSDMLTKSHLESLNSDDRPTYLLDIKTEKTKDTLPKSLQKYIISGEKKELHKRALIMTRNPWFKMEQREVPPILFAYLGRRNARFILNQADAVPLTGFLCIYPHDRNSKKVRALWEALNHPDTIQNLKRVGKSYGDGAVKVEPKSLQVLPIPMHVLKKYCLV
jgi:adenine-specific DNA-methyltransferase